MSFALPRLASNLPHLAAILSLGLTTACGDKGGDDGGTGGGGSNAVETVFAFDSGVEGFKFEDYTPGDVTYTNIFDVAPANATIAPDAGNGPDGKPGRAKLSMNFTNWNQLADIQVNFMGDQIKDWAGKRLKAGVMLESGFSANPSCPGGTYLFVKTGADYVWARGGEVNMDQATLNQWQNVTFVIDVPTQQNSPYDPLQIVSVGLQFYSNGGGGCSELPTPATVYVDHFTVEDAM